MQRFTRNAFLAAALSAGFCAFGPWSAVRADEKMPAEQTKMSADQMKMASDHMDKMKMMAADQPQEMAAKEAKMLVADKMAMHMAMDPQFKEMLMQSMSDPNMKKVHADAKIMAEDPAQRAKMQQELMADPQAMQMIMHMAKAMTMMHDGMMHDSMTKDGKMKDMPADKK
jgi:hypothetical protein